MTPSDSSWDEAAYVDGELDLDGQLAMEERLRRDPDLRSRVQGLRRLREVVRTHAEYHAAGPALRAQVHALLAPASRPARVRRRFTFLQWAAVATVPAAAVLALALMLVPPTAERRIEEDIVASHVRATLGQRSVDVASSDHHTVKPWLSARLDFSPDVGEPRGGGASLIGGRVDYVDGRPVAALVYRAGAHLADDFTWPSPHVDQPPSETATRGFNVVHWTRHGMTHWLISDLNREELGQLARKLAVD